jgi:hypothetical protein
MKYNHLTINYSITDGKKVLCTCDCGNEKFISKYFVEKGITKSCGCIKKTAARESGKVRQKVKIEDWLGKKINYLTILGEEYVTVASGAVHRYLVCSCECGNFYKGCIHMITKGKTKSCGCWKVVADSLPKSHGLSNTRIYNIWCGLIARTTNPNEQCYENYGGRGIKVCDRWKSFENFYEDMFSTYSEELSIDRIDVNLGYSKENCRWVTMSVQGHNKRKLPKCLSDYIGVTFDDKTSKWRSRITLSKGNRKHLGMFTTQLDAAIAYDNASEEVYGDRPNKTVK